MSADLVAGYVQWMKAAGRSPQTVATRRRQVVMMLRAVPDPLTCTERDLLAWLSDPGWKPATRASNRAACKSFFQWLQEAEHRADDPSRRLPSIKVPPPCPHPASDDAVANAREQAKDPWEACMVELAVRAGLRRFEIAGLRFSNLDTDERGGDILRVTGKGGKTRIVPIAPDLADQIRALHTDWIFPSRWRGEQMGPDHVGQVLSRLLGPGYSGHSLRHRFATRAYAGSRDILAVQRLLGHSSPATTQIYVQIPMDSLRQAVNDAR